MALLGHIALARPGSSRPLSVRRRGDRGACRDV